MTTRILAGTQATLEVLFYLDGTLTDPTGAPTCAVVDEAGNAVASGAATIVGASSGKLQFALTAANTTQVNHLTATWAGVVLGGAAAISQTTRVDVVGDLLFTEAEARAFDNAALTSATTYPDSLIAEGRDRIAESFEEVCRAAWGLSYGREVLDGDGSDVAWLGANRVAGIRSIKYRTRGETAWTAYTTTELDDVLVDRNGRLTRESLGTFLSGRRNIAIEYEHGWQPIPSEVKRAALWLLRDQLSGTDLPRNAISQSSEIGTFSLSVPGLRGSYYGLPQVDEVIRRYSQKLPGVG